MIIDRTHNITTNIQGSTEFSVSDDSAKIFSFLSNFLYKDKERSVITELCSNALDAHIMVGKEKERILVHLPTDLQKEFRVRDYGPGLSEPQVYQFLTKYGSSSKGQSNEFIGGFGIGSKSPAAVTDTWTINSHNEGEMKSYLIHVNDKGIPSINKLFTKPSTESGLEVIVPVANGRLWHDASVKVFEHYELLPEIKGTRTIPQITYVNNYKGLAKFTNVNLYGTGSVFVIMNRRSYLIDMSKIGKQTPFSSNAYLPFPTSELSVSLSREDLQYDSKTIDAIKLHFDKIEAELLVDWKAEVSCAKSIYDYKQLANNFKTKNMLKPIALENFAAKAKDTFSPMVDFNRLDQFELTMNDSEAKGHFVTEYKSQNLSKLRYNGRISINRKDYNKQLKTMKFSSKVKGDITFVLSDVKSAPSRVKLAIAQNKIQEAVILEKDWFDIIPNDFEKILASSLEKPVVVRAKVVRAVSAIYEKNGNKFVPILDGDVDKTKPVVCIRFSNAGTTTSIIDLKEIKFVEDFTKTVHDVTLIFIKPKEKMPQYAVTPLQWAERIYKSMVAQIPKMNDAYAKKELSKYTNRLRTSLIGKIVNFDSQILLVKAVVFAEVVKEISRLKSVPEDLTILSKFDTLNKCADFIGTPRFEPEIYDFENKLVTAYPMLEYVTSNYISDSDLTKVLEYVNMCGR